MIEFEITQYTPINFNDYVVKYKRIKADEDKLNVQVILVPKYVISLCDKISKKLGSKIRILNVNCDIIQKLLSLNLIEDFNKDGIIIEIRDKDFILNMIKNKQIYESYILANNEYSYKSLINYIKEFRDIYYYGDYDLLIEKYLSEMFNVKPIKLNIDINFIDKNIKEKSYIEHVNCIGMII